MGGPIHSVGYEGEELEGFVARLADAGVTLLVDVRKRAGSRRRGFAKTALSAALGEAGIEYRHEPSLGNPPENREPFRRGDPAAREQMRALVEGTGAAAVDRLAEDASQRPVAVLCVEADPATCHRSIVIEAVHARRPDIRVVPGV